MNTEEIMPDVNGNVSECREYSPPAAYTLKKAAEILGVTDAALYARAKRGAMLVFEKNGQKMVTRHEVERLKKEREKRAAKKSEYFRKQKSKKNSKKERLKAAEDAEKKAIKGAAEMKEHLDNIPVFKKTEEEAQEKLDGFIGRPDYPVVPEVAGNHDFTIPIDTIPEGTRYIRLDMVTRDRRIVVVYENVSIGITFHK
jgi:hypothetical protein